MPVAKQTFEMLADSGMTHLAPHARTALEGNYVRPSKRIFDNAKVSDHFAIIPTLQAPSGLSEAEQKLYDLVVRRFMAVFFPSAEYLVTTRISKVEQAGKAHHFKTDGKVLVKPGWLAIYGKEAAAEVTDAKEGDKGQNLVPVKPGERPLASQVDPKALKTKPPARYSEATLLGAMEERRQAGRRRRACARPCRKRAWARPPRAPPPSKACWPKSTCCAKAARSSPRPRPSSS